MNLLAMIYETTGKMQKRKNILNINNVIHDPCTPSLFANTATVTASAATVTAMTEWGWQDFERCAQAR